MFGLYEPELELISWCSTADCAAGLEKAREAYINGIFGEVVFVCQKILERLQNQDEGKNNPDRMQLELFLAGTMTELDAAEGRTHFERLLPELEKTFGDTHELVVDATLELALAYLASHKYKSILRAQPVKAEKLVKALLKRQENAHGRNHHSLIPILITLRRLLDARQKSQEAQEIKMRIALLKFSFKDRLNEIRIRRGLTTKKLSTGAGCHPEMVDELSDTDPLPEIDTLLRLSRVLGVNTADFFKD